MRLTLIAFAVAACAACTSSPAPSALLPFEPGPTPTIYLGSIQDSESGPGTLRLSLSTAAGVTAGTWDATFSGRPTLTRTVTGTIANNVLTATVRVQEGIVTSPDGCTFTMTSTFSANGLSGTYVAFAITPTCPTLRSGSFALTRQ
jgi:hypothetical protein